MESNWYKLDNVSKLFLAAYTKRDPRTMRVSCALNEQIQPDLLQQAVEQTMQARPQFQVRIRRGFFWHYMEQTDAKPLVEQETGRPCPLLYGEHYQGVLHYQVTYYFNRINLDIFHVLSDGTGALSLLNELVLNYLKLAHPGALLQNAYQSGASAEERNENSYARFYENSEGLIPKTILNKKKKAYQIQGRKLPYDQLRFLEVHMETADLLRAAKEAGVSLTSYLGAQLMLAIHATRPSIQHSKPINISIPVNLRNYYPSETLRNFFNSVDVSHVFDGNETLQSLAKEFDQKLHESIEPEKIRAQMNRYESFERVLFTRVVPLMIKQPVVRMFGKKEAKTVTAVLSNLGTIKVSEEMKPYIKYYTDYCSTEKLFITATGYEGKMVLGVACAYANTGMLRRFIANLQETGTPVTVFANEIIR